MNKYILNSENEKIEIKEVENDAFKGQHILMLHDDRPVRSHYKHIVAYHLLDSATIDFLLKALKELKTQTSEFTQELKQS